jgi:hypothetical protein
LLIEETADIQGKTFNKKAHNLTADDDFLRHVVVRAIGYGSSERSPFLHGCPSYSTIRAWHKMAMGSEFQRTQTGLMVRIDVEKIGRRNIIDLSNRTSAGLFFTKGADGHTEAVRQDFHFVGRSERNYEVLVMWRGLVDLNAFEVVDENTGIPTCPLLKVLSSELADDG